MITPEQEKVIANMLENYIQKTINFDDDKSRWRIKVDGKFFKSRFGETSWKTLELARIAFHKHIEVCFWHVLSSLKEEMSTYFELRAVFNDVYHAFLNSGRVIFLQNEVDSFDAQAIQKVIDIINVKRDMNYAVIYDKYGKTYVEAKDDEDLRIQSENNELSVAAWIINKICKSK